MVLTFFVTYAYYSIKGSVIQEIGCFYAKMILYKSYLDFMHLIIISLYSQNGGADTSFSNNFLISQPIVIKFEVKLFMWKCPSRF